MKPLQANIKGHKKPTYRNYKEGAYITNWYCVICGKPIKWGWCNSVYFPHLNTCKDTCEECWGKYTTDTADCDNLFIGEVELKRKENFNKALVL